MEYVSKGGQCPQVAEAPAAVETPAAAVKSVRQEGPVVVKRKAFATTPPVPNSGGAGISYLQDPKIEYPSDAIVYTADGIRLKNYTNQRIYSTHPHNHQQQYRTQPPVKRIKAELY
ncbi:hypothetical protein OESDEN_25214 [Oesophagostomum dentatum]|uniref:Uncharacterized protein n=1 Tax=Oesophagostomum dentatum TaxID=61180 RepID=A0A0B1RVX3_OESDE|nr:hypothetical protein OESDEN_25214 [Oesophagostomum dentatum]